MIRTMTASDVRAVTDIHLRTFPGFFLSFLGPRFLELYYAGVCGAPEGIAFVCAVSGVKPAGFVAGTSNPRGFYSRLLRRRWLSFAIASLGTVIKKPAILPRLFRALVHPASNPAGEDVAGLYSIGVLPEFQGAGAATELVNAFLDAAVQRGCRRVFLTTDRDDNEAVNAFYVKRGFRVGRRYETPEGRRMNEYWIDL
jgi:ribosomal protein S18 acetylase RimI-like enzyme